MSKNKRKGLFETPQNAAVRNDGFRPQEISVQTESTELFESEQYHKVVRSELISVFLIIAVMGVVFSVIWFTNQRFNWIDGFSTALLHNFVRGY